MARRCEITQKKPSMGRKYSIRGIAKKKKGIGLNITGKTKRRFLPNLVKKRIWSEEEGRYITLRLSTKALRTITKHGLSKVLKDAKRG